MNLKEKWIEAYKYTHQEYINNTRILDCRTCAKCMLTLGVYGYLALCDKCPEGSTTITEWGAKRNCGHRFCRPLNLKNSMYLFSTRLRVIRYHERAIAYLQTVLPITFEKHIGVIQKHLKEIDKAVYEKYS